MDAKKKTKKAEKAVKPTKTKSPKKSPKVKKVKQVEQSPSPEVEPIKAEKRKDFVMPEVKMVVIEVTKPRGVGLPGKVTEEGVTTHYGLRLLPGENNVPVNEWERVRTHKTVKMYLDAGILLDKGPGKAKKLNQGLDALEKFEAIAQIEKCNIPQILDDWYTKTEKIDLRNKLQEKLQTLKESKE